MDAIDAAREAMERADDQLQHALDSGFSDATCDDLAQAVFDAEHAYYRACDTWGR